MSTAPAKSVAVVVNENVTVKEEAVVEKEEDKKLGNEETRSKGTITKMDLATEEDEEEEKEEEEEEEEEEHKAVVDLFESSPKKKLAVSSHSRKNTGHFSTCLLVQI